MPETITILSNISVPVGSQVTEAFSIPYHENPVTFTIRITRVGTGYRTPSVLVNEQVIYTTLTGMSQYFTKTVDLTAGTHSITVKTDPGTQYPYGTGPFVFDVTATYEPIAGPPVDFLPIIVAVGTLIVATAGGWVITDGFTKIPDPSQLLSGIQLPELKLPF